jgi:hypothetical protein
MSNNREAVHRFRHHLNLLLPATLIVLLSCSGAEVRDWKVPEGRVSFQLYIMSKCPYAAQVLKNLEPVLTDFGPWVDFRMEFIGTEKNGSLTALHGEQEVKGNLVYACAQHVLPEKRRYYALVSCMNATWRQIPDIWEQCAAQVLSPDESGSVRTCIDGGKGEQLLRASFARSAADGARGSPTMKLNGALYKGGREPIDFKRAMCAVMIGARPPVCENIPLPVRVEVVVIDDKRCTTPNCDSTRLESQMRVHLPGIEFERFDWSDAAAQKMFDEFGLSTLPALLFPSSVLQLDEAKRIGRWLRETASEDWMVLKTASKYDPRQEICDNAIDDTGNGRVDCEDKDCHQTLLCRPEVPGQLEIFVMSQCPYATRALDAMKLVMEAFKSDPLTFVIHYIGDVDGQGKPTGLHGQSEVDENIRQLCVAKHYPQLLMQYLWCRNPEIRKETWGLCYRDGIDQDVIESCFQGPGTEMLLENYGLGRSMGISGSPTWIVNGRQKFGGARPAETIQEHICKFNPGFTGCAQKIIEGGGQ